MRIASLSILASLVLVVAIMAALIGSFKGSVEDFRCEMSQDTTACSTK